MIKPKDLVGRRVIVELEKVRGGGIDMSNQKDKFNKFVKEVEDAIPFDAVDKAFPLEELILKGYNAGLPINLVRNFIHGAYTANFQSSFMMNVMQTELKIRQKNKDNKKLWDWMNGE